jgi:hypothetical protein
MRKQLVLLVLVALFSVPVFAEGILKVNVPFAFVAADKTLPAGEYYFVSYGSNGIVRIRDFNTHISVFSLSDYAQRMTIPEVITQWMPGPGEVPEIPGMENATNPAPIQDGYNCAVFSRYGDNYFLSTIWLGYSGRTFPEGTMEREIKSAQLFTNPETVTLVANRIR